MFKKVLMFSLSLLLIPSLNVFGAKKPINERMIKRLQEIEAPVRPKEIDRELLYLTAPEPGMFVPQCSCKIAGYTYYDYQANDVQRRQIANDYQGNLHFTWMDLTDSNMNYPRFVDYNALYPNGTWLLPEGMHVTSAAERGGYPGLDILPDSREVLCFHLVGTPPDSTTFWGTTIAIERSDPGYGEFNLYDIPDSIYGKHEKGIWPNIACSKKRNLVGSDSVTYIHITHTEGQISGNVKLAYVRCYQDPTGPPGNENLICESPGWDTSTTIPPGVRLVPNKVPKNFATVLLGGSTIATSPVSHKVAIVWLQNTGTYADRNELTYVESPINGDDWMAQLSMPPVPITSYYAADYEDRAYADIAAVYDYNDVIHIMWTTFKKDDANHVTLWHWSNATGIRKVTEATASPQLDPGGWNLLFAKFNIGVGCIPADSAYNYLYVNYTRFKDGDASANGYANGDIWAILSSNGGLTWGADTNLTNTNSNGCTDDCMNEHWSSIAERVDSFLHVQYVEDKEAGAVPKCEPNCDAFTQNPICYLGVPRPFVPAIPNKVLNPTQMISPVKWAIKSGSVSDTLLVDNTGTATLYVKVSGPPYVTITPNSFSIIEGRLTREVYITFSGTGLQDTFLVDSIMVISNHGLLGGAEVYVDTEWVKFHFVVTDSFYYTEYDTVSTQTMVTTVSNVGNLGNAEKGNMMNYNGHDYLYNCSPVLCTDIPGYGNVGASWVLDRHDFLPESHLQVTDCSGLKSTRVKSTYVPINPTIAPPYHWFWWWWSIDETELFFWNPVHAGSKTIHCEQAILKSVILHKNPPPPWWCHIAPPPPTLPEVYFGIAADWDVPAEAYAKNLGGYDDTLNLIWQKADSLPFSNYYGAILFLGANVIHGTDTVHYNAPFGAHVLNNATQLYPLAGYNDDSLYKYLSTPGWSIEQDSAQDMNIVMSAIPPLGDLDTVTQITMKYVLMVTDKGLDSLRYLAAQFRKVKCGDANVDGKVTVSDVVYKVNYLFKGGPEPWLYYTDDNGDCRVTVSDVVYEVNYLFKGGPPPRCDCPTCDP